MSVSSKNSPKITDIICGELCHSNVCNSETVNLLNSENGDISANVSTKFEKFVEIPQELPNRIVDLLQIAVYVFCADRCVSRGARNSVGNGAWGRSLNFQIPVNDIEFWSSKAVSKSLEEALVFMTGDRQYHFEFSKATKNDIKDQQYQTPLFSMKTLNMAISNDVDIMLFSGGLDSLAGAIERLNRYPDRKLCLVNHMSNNRTVKTQRTLVAELKKKYDNQVIPYTFECRFKKLASIDETQRTRMFMFSAIAFAICNCYGKHEFYVYENGITSINLPKQMDLINARASRTTHPKTIGLLLEFYKQFDQNFKIETPFRKFTKEEIVKKFQLYGEEVLIQSSVSCSSTRNTHEIAPHCGCCSQCIDRRFAMYAAGLAENYDNTFALSVPYDRLNEEAMQRVSSTLMFASKGIGENKTEFLKNYPSELIDAISYWPNTPDNGLEEIFQLYCRYIDSIHRASKAMQASFDATPSNSGTFFDIVSQKLSYDQNQQKKFEECISASVFVIANDEGTRQGTGFRLFDYGLLTSYHLTEDNGYYRMYRHNEYPLSCGIISKEINELCRDKILDYALYDQCKNPNRYFMIGNSDALKIGDVVKVIGFPNYITGDSYDLRLTEICRKTKLFNAPLYVVSSAIYHGASGGIVLDKDNRIVGIVRAGIETAEEQPSFDKSGFVPINLIIDNIDQKGV